MPRFEGSADSGARQLSRMGGQLRREDLADMTPEQIMQARKEGRMADLGYGTDTAANVSA